MCPKTSHNMPGDKSLPPTPAQSVRSAVFSPESYTRILEEENEQLRLLVQQLSQQRNILESRLADEKENRTAMSTKLSESRSELEARDSAMADVAATIIVAFRRYTSSLPPDESGGREIPGTYSYFDNDSQNLSP